MNNTSKSNLKRIRDLLLSDENEDDYITSQDSDLENDYDFVPDESDDTSTDEHISEESDASDDDEDQSEIFKED
ncbi:hypothetical protein I4U23_005185 [Adineta vaga]|nr:hypothetical protein I4U23_005185 [Adineta vaga]